jgi:hypothetical protein
MSKIAHRLLILAKSKPLIYKTGKYLLCKVPQLRSVLVKLLYGEIGRLHAAYPLVDRNASAHAQRINKLLTERLKSRPKQQS